MSVNQGLADRNPHVSIQQMVDELVPPPRFAHVSFSSYIPASDQPSQSAAVAALEAFSQRISKAPEKKRLFKRGGPPEGRAGIYLDGGFGVGKTHLLASLWHSVPGRKRFGTFVEYTNLVGALGFRTAVDALSHNDLVCIDEFELDDPGDTVLMSTLLGELVKAGVSLAATSNTLPDKLGEGRFAAEDFLREIQGLSAHFDVFRIEGEDYRHRGLPEAPQALSESQVFEALTSDPDATIDEFSRLEQHLTSVHPSRYGSLLNGVSAVGFLNVEPVTDQATALRLVVLTDRLYDRDIPVLASGIKLDELFSAEMLKGGYRKKYFRAISRLVALAREGAALTR